MGSATATHRWEAHAGEAVLELHAPDMSALLSQAGLALAELLAGELPDDPSRSFPEPVTLSAPDRAHLLVEWLKTLVSLSGARHRVHDAFALEADDRHVRGTVRGFAQEAPRTQIKDVTLRHLDQDPAGALRARVSVTV